MDDKQTLLNNWLLEEDREYEEGRLRYERAHERRAQIATRAAQRINELEADLVRAQEALEKADVLADAIATADPRKTPWPEFNRLLAACKSYRATRSGTETTETGAG